MAKPRVLKPSPGGSATPRGYDYNFERESRPGRGYQSEPKVKELTGAPGFPAEGMGDDEGYRKGGAVGGSKQKSTKPLPAAGSDPGMSAMVGGVGNRPTNPSMKKTGSRQAFARGGSVGIPAHVEGGFRNPAMEHKR